MNVLVGGRKGKFVYVLRGLVCGCDGEIVGNMELFENIEGIF